MPPHKRNAKAAMLNGGAITTNRKHAMLAKRYLKHEPGEVSYGLTPINSEFQS
jgi:hypothetical protein